MDLNILIDSIEASIEKKFLILAIDGHIDNLVLISYYLESCGYKIITASLGKDALSIAREYLPDLILLEVVLPDIDGLELVAFLKRDELTSSIPIIALTGLATEEDRESIFRSGCDAYLGKPYLLENLANIVLNYLRKI